MHSFFPHKCMGEEQIFENFEFYFAYLASPIRPRDSNLDYPRGVSNQKMVAIGLVVFKRKFKC